MTRKECINKIKDNQELKDCIKKNEGKAYTNCTTQVLEYYIVEYVQVPEMRTLVERFKQLINRLINDFK